MPENHASDSAHPTAKATRLPRVGQWLAYAAFRTFEAILRLLPLPAVFTLGEIGGGLAWAVASPYRRLVLDNLRIAYGRELDDTARRHLARAHFRRLGANLLSSLKVPTMPRAEIEKIVAIEGIEHVHKGIRDNLGFIYAICHMGNWEVLAQMPDICPTGKPGTLFQPLSNPFLNAHIARLRSRFGFRLFDRHDGFHTTVQFLRDGGGLGVLVDQHAGDSGVWCPLFGRLASTTNLGALLTLRTGGPGLPSSRDLLRGQGAVGSSEPQGERQRAVAVGHLRPGVHIEQADVLAQVPRTRAEGSGDIGHRDGLGDHEGDVLLRHRLRHDLGCRRDGLRSGDEGIEIDFDRARTRWQGVRRDDPGMELARVADDCSLDAERGRATGMERCVTALRHVQRRAQGGREDARHLDRIRPADRPSGPPPSGGFACSGEDHC